MTQGIAVLLLRKMEAIEQHLLRLSTDHPAFLTVLEFCHLTGTKRSTVTTWLNLGKLHGRKTGSKGHSSPWEIPYEEYERYVREGL